MNADERRPGPAKARVQVAGRSDDATVDYDSSTMVRTLIRDLVNRFGLGDPQDWVLYAVSGAGKTERLEEGWRIADHLREPTGSSLRLVPYTVGVV